MKILLIEPHKAPTTFGGEEVFLFEPLALEYLAVGVGRDHEVRIIDLRLDRDLPRLLAEFQPAIVGITAYTAHLNTARTILEQVKRDHPKTLTVVGGHHATVARDDFRAPFIDLIVVGEGVAPFRELVARFARGEAFAGIPGVYFPSGDRLVGTEPSATLDLDALPFPDRTLTAPYRKHYYSEWMKPLASIRTSKGCPFRCRFCAQWQVAGGRYFTRAPERIVAELREIAEECVFFADDESLVDHERMMKLADLIRKAGIRKRYFLYGRSDTIANHPELMKAWRAIGLERVFVGLEFAGDDDLDLIRKGSTAQDNERAIAILQELGLDIYASFIVRPEFTPADFAALRNYCRRLKLDFAAFSVLTPLPGTELRREVEAQLITRNPDHVDFIHTLLPTLLPREKFYREYARLYREAVSPLRQLALLRKYPLREIPGLLRKARRLFAQLEKVHLDYQPDVHL